jgi:hypothetical protein
VRIFADETGGRPGRGKRAHGQEGHGQEGHPTGRQAPVGCPFLHRSVRYGAKAFTSNSPTEKLVALCSSTRNRVVLTVVNVTWLYWLPTTG